MITGLINDCGIILLFLRCIIDIFVAFRHNCQENHVCNHETSEQKEFVSLKKIKIKYFFIIKKIVKLT